MTVLLGPHIQNVHLNGRPTIPVEKQILLTLWYLATPDSYSSVVTKFGVGPATAWRSVMRVVAALYLYRNVFIRWPNELEATQSATTFENRYGYPGIVGIGDGTHFEIEPPMQDRPDYICRKGFPSLQAQANVALLNIFLLLATSNHTL